MKQIISLQFLLVAGWCCCAAYGQSNDVSKNIIEKLTAFSSNHTTEKAYLQFDKPYYAAGDTIYFKAYVTEGEHHRLSGLSGVLHVDLINTKNKTDQSLKLQLDSGVAWGDFALPDSLPMGNYAVRAYTQWMRNNGEEDFFNKIIPVGSLKIGRIPESLVKQHGKSPNLKPDVQFFPEGGSLVAGIKSKVAFKAVGADGLGIDIEGAIVDNENKEVASFASSHLGMGYFYLSPEDRKTYTAKISYPNGQRDAIVLPKPDASGIELSVNNDSLPTASVSISASSEYYKNNKGKAFTLVVYSGGLITTVNCKLDSPVIKLYVLKRKLHTGVATITLFSPDNEPLSERLLFIQNYDDLDLNINTGKSSYAQREKVNIKLNAIDRKGDPAIGHFSVSVTDEGKMQENEQNKDNILSCLLLTSDLKGYVEQPNYYFEDTSATARKNLDILMLTQGYRRFTWKEVLDSTKQTLAYQPERGIEINGQVKNLFNKPVVNGTITLISSYKGPVLSSKSDDKGMFRFSNLIFTDTAHFILSAVNARNKNSTKISWFDKPNEPIVYSIPQQAMLPVTDTTMALFLNNDKLQQDELVKYGHIKGIMLKQVNIHSKKLDDQYRTQSLAGAGHADQLMHADEIERVGGPLTTSLDGRLHGIVFVGLPLHKVPVLTVIGGGHPMYVIIDGAEVPADDINLLNAEDVETVEVLKYASASIYGMNGGAGVLIITTKQTRGLALKDIPSIGVLPISPMGFYKAREFYSPKYDNTTWVTKQRDLRSTIFWKPEIKTDKDGNASFEYYNADGRGTNKIVVEGIDNNGNIGRQVYRYKVE